MGCWCSCLSWSHVRSRPCPRTTGRVDEAIEGVYQLKGRPARNPLIGHVLDPEAKLEWAPTALVSRDTLLRLSPSDVHYQRMKCSDASGPWLSGDRPCWHGWGPGLVNDACPLDLKAPLGTPLWRAVKENSHEVLSLEQQ